MLICVNDEPFLGTAREFLPAVLALPKTATYVKNEEGFIAPSAAETVFALSGECVFLNQSSAKKFFGVLKNTTNILVMIRNEYEERCLINFNSAFQINWDRIFGMFSDDKPLQMSIIGGNNFVRQGRNNFDRFAQSLIECIRHSSMGTVVNVVAQFTMQANVIISPDGGFINSELESRYWNDRLGDPSHQVRSEFSIDLGAVQTLSGTAAFFGAQKAEIGIHNVRGEFLSNVIISPEGKIYEVSAENCHPDIAIARKARALEAETMREDHMPTSSQFSKKDLLLVYDGKREIVLGQNEDDLTLIARLVISESFLAYAAERAALGRDSLAAFFKDNVAPRMIVGGSLSQHEEFAQERAAIIMFLAHLYECRETERAKDKPPGPWAEGYRFGKP